MIRVHVEVAASISSVVANSLAKPHKIREKGTLKITIYVRKIPKKAI